MKGLIIAGGESSRMKQDKATLVLDNEPLYLKLHQALYEGLAPSAQLFISTREDATYLWSLAALSLEPLFDEPDFERLGPASALVAAHHRDRKATWFVVACDFPRANAEAIQSLKEAHLKMPSPPEITCFGHEDGTPEPLFAIWTPQALQRLEENVRLGLLGPLATLKKSNFYELAAKDPRWLVNVNTPEQWAKVK